MEQIRWGILGTAAIAEHCTIPGLLKAENARPYAIAGRTAEKIGRFQREFGFEKAYIGYDALLQDPEVQAVYIPLTNDLHKEWVIRSLRAGKHVLCEKPMALCEADAREMQKAAEENGVLLMEAFAYLHNDFMKSLIADVKGGAIGDVVYIDTAFVTQGYKTDFRLKKAQGGGMIYDLGCYCTTMILSLVDSPVRWTRTVAEKNEDGVDAFTAALIGFENGARASFNVGMILGQDSNARYDRLFIHGTKADLRSEAEYNGQGTLKYRILRDGKITEKAVPVGDNYAMEIAQLSRCIQSGEKPGVSPDFTLKNAALLDRLLKDIDY